MKWEPKPGPVPAYNDKSTDLSALRMTMPVIYQELGTWKCSPWPGFLIWLAAVGLGFILVSLL